MCKIASKLQCGVLELSSGVVFLMKELLLAFSKRKTQGSKACMFPTPRRLFCGCSGPVGYSASHFGTFLPHGASSP